jgi:hypothetical protein
MGKRAPDKLLMYTTAQLTRLAQVYIEGTGVAVSRLGTRAANNDRLFTRLFQGMGCRLDVAERAAWFFNVNWPRDVAWPCDVERRSIPQPQPRRRRLTHS